MNNDYIKNRAASVVVEKKKLISKGNIEALLSGIFAFFGSVFAAIIVTGYDFDLTTFTNPKFYLATAISFGIMMYTFNFVKRVVVASKKNDKVGDYYKAKEREERMIKHIRDNHLENEVERIVNIENESSRKAAAQAILDKVTYGLSIDLIEDLDNKDNPAVNQEKFYDFVNKRDLSKRAIKKLRKAIADVLQGKYHYERIATHELLVDVTLDHKRARQLKVNESKLDLSENRRKAMIFIISTAVTNALVWSGLSEKFWTSLLGQLTLIMSSIISAYMVATKRVDTLTLIAQNRCDFLNAVYFPAPVLVAPPERTASTPQAASHAAPQQQSQSINQQNWQPSPHNFTS